VEVEGILMIAGSLSLEFTRLAQLTGKKKYFDGISRIMDHLDQAQNKTRIPGLWPWTVDTTGPIFPSATFTLGAWADSLYEYLPKVAALIGSVNVLSLLTQQSNMSY
jgi:mannosyl-oligosaccharide alpha-1,2-mannosidase